MAKWSRPALLIVDVQNDFCPGGALAVKNGDKVIPPLNRLAKYFDNANKPVIFSRDWHKRITKHFAEFGGPWPVHGVENTWGAEFHPDLWIPKGAFIINKGNDPDKHGYSPFEGRTSVYTLDELLQELWINELYIGGLATDYCVKNAILDALLRGCLTRVCLITDACRAVNLKPTDGADALEEMKVEAIFKTTEEVLSEVR